MKPAKQMTKEERLKKSSYAPVYKEISKEFKLKIKKLEIKEKELNKVVTKILKLRKKGLSMGKIGEEFGLSREMIRLHVLKNMTPKQQKLFNSVNVSRRLRVDRITRLCAGCGKKMTILPSCNTKSCSHKCSGIVKRRKTPWKYPLNIGGNKRTAYLYAHNSAFKKIHAGRMQNWYKNLRKDPVRFAEYTKKQNVYIKRYQEKKRLGRAKTKLPELF